MTVATKERAPSAKPKAAELKAVVDRADLLRALAHAAAIVERRNTIPILANVMIRAGTKFLWITATDLDLQVVLSVPAQIEIEGATTVPAQLIAGIVRELEDGSQVELVQREGKLHVNSGRSHFRLQSLPSNDFPQIAAKEAKSTFAVPAPELLSAIRRIEHAKSADATTRSYLCGINADVEDGKLVLAATDGNQMAYARLPVPEGAEVDGILPTKLVVTLAKLLDGVEGDVTLAFGDRKATIEVGTTVITSKLVEGTYPNWRRVIPIETGKVLRISAATLKSAVRRAALVATEKTRAAKLEFGPDKLTVSVTSVDHGVGVEEVPCNWSDGEFVVGFNSRYLLNILEAAGDCDIEVALIDAAAPTLFSNPADDSAKWVLMPLRV